MSMREFLEKKREELEMEKLNFDIDLPYMDVASVGHENGRIEALEEMIEEMEAMGV